MTQKPLGAVVFAGKRWIGSVNTLAGKSIKSMKSIKIRRSWTRKPVTKVKPSYVYDRKKREVALKKIFDEVYSDASKNETLEKKSIK